MNEQYFLPFLFYSIATAVLFLASVSWITAYRVRKSISVLSFAMFFSVVTMLNFVITFDLFRLTLGMYKTAVPYLCFRAFLMMTTSVFLLYGTWRNNA